MPVSTGPGEVARVMRHHLYQTCLDHGCIALSQLQQVMRVCDQADHDSVIALLLQRLDEQGLKISSPWAPVPCRLAPTVRGLALERCAGSMQGIRL